MKREGDRVLRTGSGGGGRCGGRADEGYAGILKGRTRRERRTRITRRSCGTHTKKSGGYIGI